MLMDIIDAISKIEQILHYIPMSIHSTICLLLIIIILSQQYQLMIVIDIKICRNKDTYEWKDRNPENWSILHR
jgi:hypothetical protein